jgi:uncharacterized protein (DUF362 family)
VVDGIVAGEGTGPIYARPRPLGVIVAGQGPVAVDIAATELLGFDHERVPMLRQALREHPLRLARRGAEEIRIAGCAWGKDLASLRAGCPFAVEEPVGWVGQLRRSR